MSALSRGQRRHHPSRAQTERKQRALNLGFLFALVSFSCLFFSFFLSVLLPFDREMSDGESWMDVVLTAGFLLQSSQIMAYRRM